MKILRIKLKWTHIHLLLNLSTKQTRRWTRRSSCRRMAQRTNKTAHQSLKSRKRRNTSRKTHQKTSIKTTCCLTFQKNSKRLLLTWIFYIIIVLEKSSKVFNAACSKWKRSIKTWKWLRTWHSWRKSTGRHSNQRLAIKRLCLMRPRIYCKRGFNKLQWT